MRGIAGHLELVCGPDRDGRPALLHQSFRAPFHISKPHRDAGALVVNAVAVSPGLMEGDDLRCTVSVQSGAHLVLTQPAAARAHRSPGREARLTQHFTVAAGSCFEYWPELFIPQGGSRSLQRTRIDLEPEATLLHFEWVAPGRIASGEQFAFDALRWETTLAVAGTPVFRDRGDLASGGPEIRALRRFHDPVLWGTALVAGRVEARSLAESIEPLHTPSCWIGVSAPVPGICLIRVLATGAPELRSTGAALRQTLHAALGISQPDLRRV